VDRLQRTNLKLPRAPRVFAIQGSSIQNGI